MEYYVTFSQQVLDVERQFEVSHPFLIRVGCRDFLGEPQSGLFLYVESFAAWRRVDTGLGQLHSSDRRPRLETVAQPMGCSARIGYNRLRSGANAGSI